MNRNLMAGCAAVALTLGCGSALAQSTFNIGIGGDAYFEAGFVSQDRDTDLRSAEFRNRFRLVITPTAKADNGLEYGARVRLRAAGGTAAADGDRAFLFMQTPTLGRLELGTVDGPSDQTYVARPQDWQMLGLWDAFRDWLPGQSTATTVGTVRGSDMATGGPSNAGNGSGVEGLMLANSALASTRINYFSPRFSGFQAALSYQPRFRDVLTSVSRAKYAPGSVTTTFGSDFQDVYELTANYAGEFSGVTIKASGGYSGGSATEDRVGSPANYSRHDLTSWQIGAQLGYAGFVLGGGYVDHGKSGQLKSDLAKKNSNTWNIGGQYTTGPVVVGIGYQETRDSGLAGVAETAANIANGTVARNGERKLSAVTVGAMYTVAPGLRTGIEYTYFEANSDRENTAATAVVPARNYDDKGSVILLRSIVTF